MVSNSKAILEIHEYIQKWWPKVRDPFDNVENRNYYARAKNLSHLVVKRMSRDFIYLSEKPYDLMHQIDY